MRVVISSKGDGRDTEKAKTLEIKRAVLTINGYLKERLSVWIFACPGVCCTNVPCTEKKIHTDPLIC